MNNPIMIKTMEEFAQFLNDNGVMEIAIRDKRKRFKRIQKVMINNLPETQEKELAQQVIHALNKNTLLNKRNLNLLSNVARLEKIGLLLNGLNLCATCAGFAIMYAKLDAMSSEISEQFAKVQKTLKDAEDAHIEFEYNKVLAEHTNMLDCQRKHQPYAEEEMRKLVDSEYIVLMLLIKTFEKDISGDKNSLIFAIYSLLAMFTVSLRNFDEIYYFNNRQVLGDAGVWHLAHDRWMSVYDKMSSASFIELLQDYGTFETKLSTVGVDIYYISLLEQVAEARSEVEDNQALIIAIGDPEFYRQYKELCLQEVENTLKAAFIEAGSNMDASAVDTAYKSVLAQVAMA